jgi:hypothetical protein
MKLLVLLACVLLFASSTLANEEAVEALDVSTLNAAMEVRFFHPHPGRTHVTFALRVAFAGREYFGG